MVRTLSNASALRARSCMPDPKTPIRAGELLEAIDSARGTETVCCIGMVDAPVALCRARAYFDQGEFRRAAHVLERASQNAKRHPVCEFFRLHSAYMVRQAAQTAGGESCHPVPCPRSQAILKSQEQQAAETATTLEKDARALPGVERLQMEVQSALQRYPDDGFLWYLYARRAASQAARHS